jgi:curved DNA-binding protein
MGVDIVDHYDILGVDRNADIDAIRSAWRRFARRHHPDVAKGRGAARRFIRIQVGVEVGSAGVARAAFPPRRTHGR